MPLFEMLTAIFADRLVAELRRGLHHAYVPHEENATRLRGKLLISTHLRLNAAHAERFYVGYDEFEADTWLKWPSQLAIVASLPKARSFNAQTSSTGLPRSLASRCSIDSSQVVELRIARGNTSVPMRLSGVGNGSV